MSRLSVVRPADLKFGNKGAILKVVYEMGTASKPDVCRVLGMSKPTVSSLIDELVNEGMLTVSGVGSSTTQGGKRPMLFSFNQNAGLVIALHIGIEEIKGAVLDLQMGFRSRIEISLRKSTVQDSITSIFSVVHKLISHARTSGMSVLGIGVSAPGVIESRRGILVKAIHLEGWADVPLGSILSTEFQLPVWIDNESRNIALAEKWFGIGKELNSFVTVQTKMGIGMGIILDGITYRGLDSSGGEFGHTTVNFLGPLCRCGNRGCWELYASERSLLQSVSEQAARHPDSVIASEMAAGREVSIQMLAEAHRAGDGFAVEQIDRFASMLAVGLVNIVNVYNPEAIILEESLPLLGESFLEHVSTLVKQSALSSAARRVVLRFTEFTDDIAMIGAASLVVREIIDGDLLWERKGEAER